MARFKIGYTLAIIPLLGACNMFSAIEGPTQDNTQDNVDLVDHTPPTDIDISTLTEAYVTESGAFATDNPEVTLALSAVDASEMSIVMDSACDPNPNWQAFESTFQITLSNPGTYNSISAKFRDEAGNESACMTAQILYSSCYGDRLTANIAKGDGSASNPYVVCTADQFKGLSGLGISNKYVELGADIDFEGETLSNTPSLSNTVFDGKNFTIKNYIITGGAQYGNAGLFPSANNSTLLNLHVENYDVSSGISYQVGGIVGNAFGSTLINVSAKNGSVNHSGTWFGGSIVGNFCNSVLIHSWSDGDVISSNMPYGIGGLAGGCGNGGATGVIVDSYFSGSVQSTSSFTGGIVGGFGGGGSLLIFKNVLSWGSVSSTKTNKAGLNSLSASINSSFFDIETSGLTPLNNSLELSTSQMKSASTFAGFSPDVWGFEDGIYPSLKEVDASLSRITVEGSSDNIEQGQCRSVQVLSKDMNGEALAFASSRSVELFGNKLTPFSSQGDCESVSNAISSVTFNEGDSEKTIWVLGGTTSYQTSAKLIPISGQAIPIAYGINVTPADSDGDGQYDIYDTCPNEAGPYWNDYCATPSQYLVISDPWSSVPANSSGNLLEYLDVYSSSDIVSCSVSNVDGTMVTAASCSCSGTSCEVYYDTGDAAGEYPYFTIDMENADGITSSKDAYLEIY